MVVTQKTPKSAIFFGLSTAKMESPEMQSKLKAAEPTIVEGPSCPGSLPKVETVSITESRISGAEEPRAMSVRLAIVGFHTFTDMLTGRPLSSCPVTVLVAEVICSMALK